MRKLHKKSIISFILPIVILDIVNYLIMRVTYGDVDFTGSAFSESHIYSTFSFITMVAIIHILMNAISITVIWLLNKNTTYSKVISVRSIILTSIVPAFTLFTSFIIKDIDFARQIANVFIGVRLGYIWLPIVSYIGLVWCMIKCKSGQESDN